MSKKVDKYIDEALSNIREDREITRELLDDAIKYLSKDESRHRDIGIVMSKYVETLQRSNEQLVKIANLVSKKDTNTGLSDKDMADIYDMISKEEG
tara:strand:+ start:1162 stop:1449 length:288 start_codon:yes stop_codon:yes gene_type:complete